MIRFDVDVTVASGLHARPASMLVNRAKPYSSVITLVREGKRADAKSILGVMGLCVKAGERITIEVDGEDEQIAAESIKELFVNQFA
ncbi:HPr family phosphocarrier protein [Brevibacillus humidisoli]|uniref:HPr family phosphocarrier protein n=1 Tax=Brevibacillus humidisoli TaxID=2895522 RepID=UPI001E3A7084|nr:HPr family phosphocarrier protein [Brevibacillus humidisoli]UFJ40568.1 HPr family phosphocarrier protein [Brevibacillus humidisoli]